MIESIMKLGPLTANQSRDILALKAAYGAFWSNPRFTKGYVEPHYSRSDVEGLLTKAAEYVVRIRSHLDDQSELSPERKKRVLAGYSGEFLFNHDFFGDDKGNHSLPAENPAKFVRDLVHSTFMDAHGYVEDLDEAALDQLIAQVSSHLQAPHEHTVAESHDILQTVRAQWLKNEQLFPLAFGDEPETHQLLHDPSSVAEMQHLAALLDQTEQTLRAIRLNRLRITRSPFLEAPDTPLLSANTPARRDDGASASCLDAPCQPAPLRNPELDDDASEELVAAATPTPTLALDSHLSDDRAASESNQSEPNQVEPDGEHETAAALTDDAPEASPVQVATPIDASPETPPVGESESPNVGLETPNVGLETPNVGLETPNAGLETPNIESELSDDVIPPASAEASSEDPSDSQESEESKASFEQIQKVAEHVDQVASEIKDVLVHVQPLCADPSALEVSPLESYKSVEKFHSTLIGYNEELLQDLMRLDDIEVDPISRQERKKQVIAIQSLMDDLDAVATKLKALKVLLKPQVDKLRAETSSPPSPSSPSSSSSSSSSSSPQSQHSGGTSSPVSSSSSPQPPTSPLSPLWQRMKMDLQWDKTQGKDAYILRTMIPGLDSQKTKVDLASDLSSFSVTGLRVPSPQEEAKLRQSLRMRYRYHPSEEDRLLMQVVAGKYGSFKSSFELPQDAIPDRISASYERGVLQITVPRRPPTQIPQRAAPMFPGHPRGYPQSSRRAPNPRGFWGDRDVWW